MQQHIDKEQNQMTQRQLIADTIVVIFAIPAFVLALALILPN